MRNLAGAVALASLLVACTSSGGDTASTNRAPTSAEYDDAAHALGASLTDRSTGDTGAIISVMKLSGGAVPLGLNVDGDGHVRSEQLGIDIDYTVACFDAAGAALASCNADTDRVDAALAISDIAISRTGNWSIEGVHADTAMLSGDGAFDVDATVGAARYTFHYDATYHSIAIDTAARRAIAGMAMFEIAGTTDGETFSLHADVAVHADRTATLTLDGDRVYTIEL